MKYAVLLFTLVLLLLPTTASSNSLREDQKKAARAICKVFGSYCGQALRVSWCESRWTITARNGQYRGLFQMGSWERRTYGHHEHSSWGQARPAYKYFVATGRGWGPWACKP